MVILTNFPPPTEGIRYQQDNTSAVISKKELGNGTIYIAESRLSWRGVEGNGFSLEYKAISLHAVSRDLSAFPSECLYLMIDGKLLDDDERQGPQNGNTSDDEDSEDENPITEIRFIPSDKGVLNAMYQALTECQLLHPDEQTDTDSEDEENVYYNSEEGIEHLSSQGLANLHRLDNLLERGQGDSSNTNGQSHDEPMDQGQFDDAEMDQ